MGLPNAAHAELDIRKLDAYCLSETHPRGSNKARVFKATLGISAADAPWLRLAILRGVLDAAAEPIASDQFGRRYRVDVRIVRQQRQCMVRTVWIVAADDEAPRFVTCWVL
jgi:hypothetical protein